VECLAGNSYWSSKRRHDAATHFPANRKQASVISLNKKTVHSMVTFLRPFINLLAGYHVTFVRTVHIYDAPCTYMVPNLELEERQFFLFLQ